MLAGAALQVACGALVGVTVALLVDAGTGIGPTLVLCRGAIVFGMGVSGAWKYGVPYGPHPRYGRY